MDWFNCSSYFGFEWVVGLEAVAMVGGDKGEMEESEGGEEGEGEMKEGEEGECFEAKEDKKEEEIEMFEWLERVGMKNTVKKQRMTMIRIKIPSQKLLILLFPFILLVFYFKVEEISNDWIGF